jgi:hypothetical protein
MDGQTSQDTYYRFHIHTYHFSLKYEKRRAGHSERAEKQIKAGGQYATQDEEDAHAR